MNMPTNKQLAAIHTAFDVITSQGLSREQLEALLMQDMSDSAYKALARLAMTFAALSTIAATCSNSEYINGHLEACQKIFFLGWEAALEKDFIDEITADDLDDL